MSSSSTTTTDATPGPKWPPASPSPVWIEIPAVDVARAKTFFSTALNMQFKPSTSAYPDDKTALITFTDPSYPCLSGGIVKVKEGCIKKGMGGVCVYFYVSDIEEAMEKIKAAGGTEVEGKKEEGGGWIARFGDLEGGVHGLFSAGQ